MKRALLIGIGTLLCPALALAEATPGNAPATPAQAGLDPDAAPPLVHVSDDTEPKSPLVPREADLLASHLLVGAGLAPVWSLGRLGSQSTAARALGTGLGFRGDIGFGLSRSVAIGLWGSYASYADGDACSSCRGRAFAVGPFVRYHLSQGLRFDPWLSLGGGYRQLSFDSGAGARQKFSGMEWLHFELGADYYLFSGFGLGPYGALGLSTYSTRPSASGDARVNTELSVGLRFLLDLPGR